MQKRDNSLKESISNLQRSNAEVTELLKSTYERQSDLHGSLSTTNGELQNQIEASSNKGSEEKEKAVQNAATAKEVIGASIQDVQNDITSSVTTHSTWVNRQVRSMDKSLQNAFEEYTRAKRARIEATDGIHANIESNHSAQHNFIASISDQTGRHADQVASFIKEQTSVTKDCQVASSKNLESIEQARATIANMGNNDDVPTGNTPRKRKWQYRDEWSLTRSREDLLRNWKQDPLADNDNNLQGDRPASTSSHLSSDGAVRRMHTRTGSVQSENTALLALEAQELRKAETMKVVDTPAEPLVESRKRNVSTIRARRAR
ncbi:hypothetical protein CVT25_003993 [Psilocybe cyanescens]|uniref:Kinesin-associated microtubule-binding domain-containing protein n=1 Tax=Psilocybe cyanescens TaxID=93625 RepID=A0A409WXV3_PSICY|nr:hypothetical protein CVT25_003993 [Psilocybe cyanescens]